MRKKIAAAMVTLAILAATYGMFLVYFSLGGKQTPRAGNGFLDLTAWRFADDGVVPLDGEWEFYPDKLLSHEDFASSPANESGLSPERIEVPGSWPNRMKTLGMATYRLQIKVGDTIPVYGLKTSSIQMSNRIIVNGEVVGSSGNPAERRSYEAVNRLYAGYFTLKPGWNEIIVQAANYEFPASSGINESIYLGYAAQISGLRDKALSHDWITFTAFLIMGLYFIGLYSQRKDDTSLIVFGLVCVFIALFTSTRGERVLFSLFGSVPFWLYLRIQMVSALGAGMGFLLYVYTAFRPFCSQWLIRIGLIVGTVLAVWAIGFIPRFATDLFRQLVTIYATFPLLYAIYVFVLAAFRKVMESTFPDLFVITPLTAVKWNLIELLKQQYLHITKGNISKSSFVKWLYRSVGTVHTFQGKEANMAVLCLGADSTQKAAAQWATAEPNLLNVAVSRAKYRLFVVGDHRLWMRYPNGKTLGNQWECTYEVNEDSIYRVSRGEKY